MRRVGKLAGSAAAWLDLNSGEVRVTRCAALLHDLGKVLIPPSILTKPGKLSEGEWAIVRRHPENGQKFCRRSAGTRGFERRSLPITNVRTEASTLRACQARIFPSRLV
jgi:response regulator RpfG family c-di-GMP phosphodiesterase